MTNTPLTEAPRVASRICDAKTTQMLRLHYTRTSLEYCQNERGEAVHVTGTNRLEIGWIRTTDLKTDLFKSCG